MRTISLRLDAESDAILLALCDRLAATQTDVVRRALELLANSVTPTPGALGLELGLVGAFASGGRGNAAGHSAAIKALLAERRRDERPVVAAESRVRDAKGAKRSPRVPKP